ncbi:hypothetical protein NOV72_00055 [Caballeronia novacaledonica]|uniref:Uncharacterized protein n=1 Tax=Caballeronia novacaledonica TaxID=1544861 RepID=A0A2U3HY75_9BURK|nr:hypothetical protein NOV72_00055 [Caballeronia novacaledonica]
MNAPAKRNFAGLAGDPEVRKAVRIAIGQIGERVARALSG